MALTKVGGGIIQQPIDVGIITATSVNASGVITATSFDGNVTGDVTGNVTGNLTGNVTGNVTGNLTGDVTGNTSGTAGGLTGTPNITVGSVTATTGNFSGNLDVGGVLTYEDVTNVDAVGIVTARIGVKASNIQIGVTGGTEIDTTSGNLTLDSAGGTTTVDDYLTVTGGGNVSAGDWTFTGASSKNVTWDNSEGALEWADNAKATFGTDNDLQIYHTGGHGFIRNTTGQLSIRDDSEVNITDLSAGYIFKGTAGGSVELYHNTSKKFETTTTGATVTGTLVSDLDLSAISASITDTAVDVFVYDTRKDSDGGAWRKKTQHTSWYNETLGTATRGTRREFPAVAVIVAENTSITIYDGDDPDLPMWMVFNTINGMINTNGNNLNSVSMLNGILVWSSFRSGIISFIPESAELLEAGFAYRLRYGLVNRNTGGGWVTVTGRQIVNNTCNDVAMTVLPNAPIDDATGLPVPTIAVACGTAGAANGGVSVIKDDGSVVDIIAGTGAGGYASYNVAFGSNNELIHTQAYNKSYASVNIFDDIPSSDVSATNSYSAARSYLYVNGVPDLRGGENGGSTPNLEYVSKSSNGDIAFGFQNTDAKLTLLSEPKGAGTVNQNSAIAYIASDYNTGWMIGNTQGAFLSSTDTTNANADTLNSGNAFDGTFASSTGWTADSDWSISGGVATCNGNDSGRFIYPTNDRWSYRRSVVVEITVTAYTSGTLSVSYGTGGATSGTNMTATGTYKFVNVTTGNDLIYIRSDSFVGSIDNVKIYYAEEDRTGNKKGLIPYGTITKSAVATGSELVGYSGNGTSNYLEQPYNSDLDFGANSEFSVMGWMYNTNVGGGQYIFDRSVTYGTSRDWQLWVAADLKYMAMYLAGGQAVVTPNNSFPNDAWFHFAAVRTDGYVKIYINGVEMASAASTLSTIPASNVPMKVLFNCNSNTKLSLFRMSSSVPSPEQIKKMYHDEKHLFQENAKATLYGSSDAVTGLAFDDDTELLHVGTSSGRSDFQGLLRINNTTTAVTTAISASDELIAEQ